MTGRPCTDCGVKPGTPHEEGCDVARCLYHGGQRLTCLLDGEDHDCGQDVWTGEWPGYEDCRRLGFWCYEVPGRGFTRCDASHPLAMPDLNRLHVSEARGEARWSQETLRWEAMT